jgi:hypothetical protein
VSKISDILDKFDMAEADYQGVLKKPSVIAAAEDFVARVLPELEPYAKVGVDMGAGLAAAGGPLAALGAHLAGDAVLAAAEAWAAKRNAAKGGAS